MNELPSFREQLNLFFNAPVTIMARLVNFALVAAILASVVISMTRTLPGLTGVEYGLLDLAEHLFAALFAVEYGLRLYAAPSRRAYIFSIYGMIDLLAILPVFFTGMMHNSLALRIARILTIVRLLKVIRYWGDLVTLLMALKQSMRPLIVVAMSVMMLAVIGGNLMYYVEPDNFSTAFDGVWWTLVTMSTVGYGDFVPHTALGKMLAGIGMFVGIGIFAVITAIIGSKIHVLVEQQHFHCINCNDVIPAISRFCMHCGHDLEKLAEEALTPKSESPDRRPDVLVPVEVSQNQITRWRT